MENFEEYFLRKTKNTDRLFYNYLGISRKEYPKWPGWKIINDCKEKGIDIKTFESAELDILVRNFYYILYFKECCK